MEILVIYVYQNCWFKKYWDVPELSENVLPAGWMTPIVKYFAVVLEEISIYKWKLAAKSLINGVIRPAAGR